MFSRLPPPFCRKAVRGQSRLLITTNEQQASTATLSSAGEECFSLYWWGSYLALFTFFHGVVIRTGQTSHPHNFHFCVFHTSLVTTKIHLWSLFQGSRWYKTFALLHSFNIKICGLPSRCIILNTFVTFGSLWRCNAPFFLRYIRFLERSPSTIVSVAVQAPCVSVEL